MEYLLKSYFLYVHPFTPVVDEAKFWKLFRSSNEGQGQWPLLLYQAMLCASANVCPPRNAENRSRATLTTV